MVSIYSLFFVMGCFPELITTWWSCWLSYLIWWDKKNTKGGRGSYFDVSNLRYHNRDCFPTLRFRLLNAELEKYIFCLKCCFVLSTYLTIFPNWYFYQVLLVLLAP